MTSRCSTSNSCCTQNSGARLRILSERVSLMHRVCVSSRVLGFGNFRRLVDTVLENGKDSQFRQTMKFRCSTGRIPRQQRKCAPGVSCFADTFTTIWSAVQVLGCLPRFTARVGGNICSGFPFTGTLKVEHCTRTRSRLILDYSIHDSRRDSRSK